MPPSACAYDMGAIATPMAATAKGASSSRDLVILRTLFHVRASPRTSERKSSSDPILAALVYKLNRNHRLALRAVFTIFRVEWESVQHSGHTPRKRVFTKIQSEMQSVTKYYGTFAVDITKADKTPPTIRHPGRCHDFSVGPFFAAGALLVTTAQDPNWTIGVGLLRVVCLNHRRGGPYLGAA